ncbi:MAG: ParB/RepB/Spo0J family partition protein [Tepidisphaeraceae bacterium]|jgi:ParB family transcriptional regulator, chromosome partitioning protein
MRVNVALSKLHPSRQNPRWVKPRPEAHRRLVASIRAFGLLEPLVVRPIPDKSGEFQVIAGNRRLAALRQIHRDSKDDPKISCEVRDVDDPTAGAMSLSENFVREAMHPLDEAEAFAKLASEEAKGAESIASQFGVTERYVRQRMKLAGLADVVKTAFREDQIDTGTAEAFSAVPEDRQLAIWQELNGSPRNAEQVRNVIAVAWIDSAHALFDLSSLSESSVSRDLFSDRVLIERKAFMEAQSQALTKEQEALREEGWAEVVAGRREEVQDRLYAMQVPEQEFDEKTARKLEKLDGRRQKLEAKLENVKDDDQEAIQAVQLRIDTLEKVANEIVEAAPKFFGEATKAVGTVFLTLDPDGQVRREFRLPRPEGRRSGNGNGRAGEAGSGGQPEPPTSDDLSDRQLAATFTHQTLAVREALLKATDSRKRILAMILHEKVRSEALAIRHEANGITLHATQDETFASAAGQQVKEKRTQLDPFAEDHFVEDQAAYDRLGELTDNRLDKLIDLLTVECVTAHLQRRTELVHQLSVELKVNIRTFWRPDGAWLTSYQKIQLVHLMAELHGSTYNPDNESRKKSELVEVLAKLFADAAEGKLEDKQLAERANQWLPSNLREISPDKAENAVPKKRS